jgi:hypothetical protein
MIVPGKKNTYRFAIEKSSAAESSESSSLSRHDHDMHNIPHFQLEVTVTVATDASGHRVLVLA